MIENRSDRRRRTIGGAVAVADVGKKMIHGTGSVEVVARAAAAGIVPAHLTAHHLRGVAITETEIVEKGAIGIVTEIGIGI